MLINIKKVLNKRDYIDLLLLADPSEKMINKYLDKSEVFVLSLNDEPVSVAAVVKNSETVCELKNLATKSNYRKQGFAKQLLQYLFQNYKNQFSAMLVGTSNAAFYEKFGFEYSYTEDKFFTKNYPEPIFENNVQCIDMIYLKKDLHTKVKPLTRSEESMMSLILDVAKKDDRIRAVSMNGSRVNPKAPKDFFQDYDIVFFVKDFNAFIMDGSWVNVFGRRLIMQLPDIMGENVPEKRFTYLMQFVDGNRLDLTVIPIENSREHVLKDTLTALLLDKDGVLPNLPEPTDEAYWIKKPLQKEYLDSCNEFWWVSTYVAKGLWRQEILYATYHIEHNLKKELLKMLRFRVGIENDFKVTAGKCDKYLETYLPKELFEKLLKINNLSDYEHCWDSLFALIDLFRRTAEFVGDKLGFPYCSEDDKNVYAFLRHVRALPSNAKTLYEE